MSGRAEERPDKGTDPVLIKCPRCGLVSEGQRCERCNAPKIMQCSGACSMCGLTSCESPDKE